MSDDLVGARAAYSTSRLNDLRTGVNKKSQGLDLPGLTIFAAGSFARLEGSEHSDIDLFFTYNPEGRSRLNRRTNELRLFGRLIDLAEELDFQEFSNDAKYLRTHNLDDVLKHVGGPFDDAFNHFTLRMLLLLESKPIFGDAEYNAAVEKIVGVYFRDYSRHSEEFQPWFLINDIHRYWMTVVLNYESNRKFVDSGEEQVDADVSARRVKNFKLRFSRLTTCYATIAAIAALRSAPSEADVVRLTHLTPRERLLSVTDQMTDLKPRVDEVLDKYSWFLEQTSLSKEDLHAKLDDPGVRQTMDERARDFHRSMYGLLAGIDENTVEKDLIRHLAL